MEARFGLKILLSAEGAHASAETTKNLIENRNGYNVISFKLNIRVYDFWQRFALLWNVPTFRLRVSGFVEQKSKEDLR